ncbi:MAG: ABC transporter permease [Alphaproteobacteria bacterium]|nr:ABC transporter permease [Alphaproteobacteria bacterium]
MSRTLTGPVPASTLWQAKRASPDYQKAWFSAPAILLIAAVFVIPLAIVLLQSLYREGFTLQGYEQILGSTLFWRILRTTLEITLEASLISLLLGYPVAYFISQLNRTQRAIAMIFVLLPFWTSILVKSFAFIVILGEQGIVKNLLRQLLSYELSGSMVFNRIGVMVGMVHFLIPFCVFPILNNLLAQPPELRRAALIMGASRRQVFFRVTFLLSIPAIVAAAAMTVVLSIGVFVTPALLGGRRDMMVANLIDYYTREALDWNMAAALSIMLLAVSGALIWVLSRVDNADRH